MIGFKAIIRTMAAWRRCSHGPMAHAGVDAASHGRGFSSLEINPTISSFPELSGNQAVPPHGPAAHGYNASRKPHTALGFIVLVLLPWFSQAAPTTSTLVPALGWSLQKQGPFPVSIASGPSGDIWVGTEGNGLWKYDPVNKSWTQFTTLDGLGDDCVYALAFDKQNRLWAGHLNHGVSVYNGQKWQNYGLLDGPLGDRVFAIAVSPKDGDVWIATDMGLARYSETRQDWDYYTRASGLPSDQIQCIAFDGKGQIYAGTQCNGLAIASPDDNFTKWRGVTAPAVSPSARFGYGLASNLINNIQRAPIRPDDSAFMVVSTPFGQTASLGDDRWVFGRSLDWREHTPGPYADQTLPQHFQVQVPVEDWITLTRFEGPPEATHTWLGYRKSGVESIDLKNPSTAESLANVATGTVIIRDILALPNEPPLFAAYDQTSGGLMTLDNAEAGKAVATGTGAASSPLQPSALGLQPSPLPAAAPIPTLDDARALSIRLGKLNAQLAPGEAWFLADDWRTQGDWIGRYGNAYVKLCGMAQGDQDYPLQPDYEVSLAVGPHHEPNATGPVWYHDNDSSDDLRSLYDPNLGHRRDAEDNDFSYDTKTYPESYDGPDLWVRAKVPDGVHCLSLYFLNNDAHIKGGNKYRDYDVQIVSGDQDDAHIQTALPLARTRVTDFWGGVYKQFLVCGPASFVVRIGRNRSFVTKLQAVFLDRVVPAPTDTPNQLPGFDTVPYDAPDYPDDAHLTPLADTAVNFWTQLDDALSLRGAVPLEMPLHIWCYRAAVAGQAPAAILERYRWEISIWTPDDRKKFEDAIKAAHDAVK